MNSMIAKYDYRFTVKAALQILYRQRTQLYDDCMQKDPTLYDGLYEYRNKTLRNLFWQAYLVEWINVHWEEMADILERHKEYSVDECRYMSMIFADYLSRLIAECDGKGVLSKLAVPDLLAVKKKALRNMIETSEKWEVNAKQLKADRKKNQAQYAKLIEYYETEGDGTVW